MSLFSVIIPTFRRAVLLREAVDSVLAQSVSDVEIIVVDDAGGEVGELPADGRISLWERSVGGGQGAAINSGVARAQGRYLTFLDDDDWYDARHLENVLPALERSPVVVCWSRYHDAPAKPGRMLTGEVGDVILDATTPNLGATAVRRDAFLPFDERFPASADVEWWLRMAGTWPVETVPAVDHIIRRHPGLRVRNSQEARMESTLRMLDLHRDWFQRHPRAAAFRYFRLGIGAAAVGDHEFARRSFLRSARRWPRLRVGKHYIRSIRRTRRRLRLSLPPSMWRRGHEHV